jgi:hypothetical protein
MANLFIHFEPTGHSLRHTERIAKEKQGARPTYRVSSDERDGEKEAKDGIPPYLLKDSPEAIQWLEANKERLVRIFPRAESPYYVEENLTNAFCMFLFRFARRIQKTQHQFMKRRKGMTLICCSN